MAGWTKGPWAWYGNRSGGVYLATTHSGRKYIMGFRRYGMNGAQPTFRHNGIMVPASELVQFEVGDGTARGFKDADKDRSVYRYDVSAIDNPDARLIAEAPAMAEALRELLQYEGHMVWCGHGKDMDKPCVCGLNDRQVAGRAILNRINGEA